jgi:speckle-type POZ protein
LELSSKDSLTVACEVTVQTQTCSQHQEPELVTPEQQLAKDLSCLLDTNSSSDVTIFAQESKFQAHKAILSARSPVFAAMFQNETKESQTNAVGIPDVDGETFGALLRFIYTGHVDNLEEVTEELFVAADKYQCVQLKMMCQEQMYRTLSTQNAPRFLVLADLPTAHHLKDQCIEFINRNSSDVVKTESWAAMVKTHPHLAAEIYVRLVAM